MVRLGGRERSEAVRRFASRLKFPKLLALVTILFILDFLVPDPIPFIDEILMGLLAGLLGMWKKRREPESDAQPDVLESE